MAQIRIEKKKSSSILPWLFGIVGLLLLGLLLVDVFDADGEPELAVADEVNFPDAHLNDDRTSSDVINARVQDYDDDAITTPVADADYDGTDVDYRANIISYRESLNDIEAEMNLEHDYSNKAIKALATSLVSLAREAGMANDLNIQQKSNKLKQQADAITDDWRETTHADKIRKAAMSSVDIIEEIQQKKYPAMNDAVKELEIAAQKIDPETLTLEQKESIKGFFQKTADVLEKMGDA